MVQGHRAPVGIAVLPNHSAKRRARRMRLTALVVTAAVGFSVGVLQQFYQQTSRHPPGASNEYSQPTGPFTYFPR